MKLKLSRTTAVIGAAALMAGGLLAFAGPASAALTHAPIGAENGQGTLILTPGTGDGTTQPTWKTTDACPTGNQGFASLYVIGADGVPQDIAGPLGGADGLASPTGFNGSPLLAGLADVINGSITTPTPGNTFELAVGCGITGGAVYVQDIFVTFDSNNNWTTSATSTVTDNRPAAHPVVSGLTPIDNGAQVTLKATIDPNASGTLAYTADGVAIPGAGSVAVTAGTVADVTVTTGAAPLGVGSHLIKATFTPDGASAVKGGSDAAGASLVVNPVAGSFGENVTVTVKPEEGAFTYTVGTGTVGLLPTSGTNGHAGSFGSGTFNYSAQMNPVTVTDLRVQSAPGWHVDGAVTDFAGSGTANGHTIPGSDLGWAPAVITQDPGNDVVAGDAIAAGTVPGLGGVFTGVNPIDGTGGVSAPGGGKLAGAPSAKGLQQSVLGGALNLTVPDSTKDGVYNATLTFTAITTG